MKKNNKVICIAGKNSIAISGLNHVLKTYSNKFEILALCDDNDDGVDRSQPSFLKYAKRNSVKIVNIEQLYNLEFLYFISLEYFKLIHTKNFNSKKLFNIHFSFLPAYKGMYTSAHPILNNERKSGCTFHLINDGIDTGDIIYQKSFKIHADDSCSSLYHKYLTCGINLVYEKLDFILNDEYTAITQSKMGSTYFSKASINYSNIELNFNTTAFQLGNQIKAYSFRDYQLPKINDRKIFGYKISENQSSAKPGQLISQSQNKCSLATIDYDIDIYYDNFIDLVNSVKDQNSESLKQNIAQNPYVINERDKNGWTPLIISVYNGYDDSTKSLLKLGANPNTNNWKGTSPLMYAKDRAELTGNTFGLELLIKYGADKSNKDMFNKSVIDYLDNNGEHYSSIYNLLFH